MKTYRDEGYVWETSRRSAIKVYRDNGEINFNREFRCYSILSENDITEVHGFNVPQLIDSESLLNHPRPTMDQ